MVTPRGARDMDDEDEWRVVRVKRRSKSNAHVGDARRKQPARPSRGTSNAFHALMDDSPSEENAEAAKEARRPDTAREKRSGGGGKARSRRRDATPVTSGTDGSSEARPEPPKAPDARDDGSDTTASNGGWTKRVNVAATAMLGRLFAPLLRASPVRDDTAPREAGDEDQHETSSAKAAAVGERDDAVPRRDAADADDVDDVDVKVARVARRAATFVPTSRPARAFAGGSRPGATGSSPGPDRAVACASSKAKHRAEPSPAPASAPPRPASPPRDAGGRGAARGASGANENENEKKDATRRLFLAARVSPGDANGHCELVRSVSCLGTGAFVTGGWDGCVRRWAWSRDGRRVASTGPLAAHADRVEFVDAVKKFHGDRRDSRGASLVVTGGRDCSLRVYDIEAASPTPLRKTYTYESVSAGCVNTNGVDVFVGARSGAASVFDVETGQKKLVFSSKKKAAHELEVTAATSTSHHGVSFISGGADGIVKGWDTRVRDGCAFEISLRDALSGREKKNAPRRVYSLAADDVSVFVGGFAGSIFAFDARTLPRDDRLSTSSSVRDAMTTIPNAPSRRHGGALRAPVAGLARARLDARNDALFSTAAYFDASRSTLDADFDEHARGCVRVFSVNDADGKRITETCALPNFGGGLVACLGVRDFNDQDEGVAIVAGDVDGGVSAWRSIAVASDAEDEDEKKDRDALSARDESFLSETNAETEPSTETSSRFTVGAVRWDAASVRGVRFGFARDDSDASEDDSEGEGDGDDA